MSLYRALVVYCLIGSLVSSGLSLSGCTKWVAIKPQELPKLNGSTEAALPATGRVSVIGVLVSTVEAPDGRLVEIRGGYDANVTLAGQPPILFERPVLAEQHGDTMRIRAANHSVVEVPLASLSAVEVSQKDGTMTAVALTIPIVLVTGILAGVLVALLPD